MLNSQDVQFRRRRDQNDIELEEDEIEPEQDDMEISVIELYDTESGSEGEEEGESENESQNESQNESDSDSDSLYAGMLSEGDSPIEDE